MSTSSAAGKQEVLLRAGMVLAAELSLPAVLQKIVTLACEVSGARYGALGVIGPDRRIGDFITHGVTDEERRRIGRLPEGRGLLGVLIEDAKPVRLARIQDDPRSAGFPPHHPSMTSFLGVPVALRGQVFGNLYLTQKQEAAEFTEEDEQAVVTLAWQAGIAIENARLYEQAHTAQRRLEAINEVTQGILEGRDADDVLRLIARRARELAGAAVATVVIPEPGDDRLVVRVAEGTGAETLEGTHFPADTSISGEVMGTRRPVVLADASRDQRRHQPLVRRGDIGPALFVPLAVRERVFGTLSVGNPLGGTPFSEESLALVRTFAAQAAVALEYARVGEELRRLALVEDRERIAKELHDDVIQSLFAEGMSLQAAIAVVHDPKAMEERLTQAVDHIDRVIRDLRNYIFALKPGTFADRQLDRALRDLAGGFGEGSGILIEVDTDPEAVSRLAGRASEVIQAAREALANAVRHSGGDRVRLGLASSAGTAVLEVADNGKGFDQEAMAGKGHGLANLRARAETLGGELEIDTAPGEGTRVRVRIPLGGE